MVETVVLYLTSTSNHNRVPRYYLNKLVVLYLTSTSNHNRVPRYYLNKLLCYILLLHQTTTYMR